MMQHGFTLQQAALKAPSILAQEPHHSRTERYQPIPTIKILEELAGHGYGIHAVSESKVRDASRVGFQKHLVRMRRADMTGVAGMAPEIILINSNDGSSSYQLMAGMFRFACANGLICGDSFESIRILHKGDIIGQVIEGSYKIMDNFEPAIETIAEMSRVELTKPEQLAFVETAMDIRFEGQDTLKATFQPTQFNFPRRFADTGNDIWTTFNRVQENMIRGGVSAKRTQARRGVSLKEVSGIDQNVRLNKALFTLAEKMLELKAA